MWFYSLPTSFSSVRCMFPPPSLARIFCARGLPFYICIVDVIFFVIFFPRPLALPICVSYFFGVEEKSLGKTSWASIFWSNMMCTFLEILAGLYGETHFFFLVWERHLYVCDLCVSCVYSACIKGLRLCISWVILEVDERHDSCAWWCIYVSHWYVWHDAFICVTWHIYMCDMTHLYVWRDSFICVTWLIYMCDMTHDVYERHDSFAWWCIHVSHWYVWHDAFICVTWRIYMCDTTHSYVWHDAFTCVTWRIHMCDMTHSYGDMTHSYVWHDTFICVTWRIHMCDMTHSYVWHS